MEDIHWTQKEECRSHVSKKKKRKKLKDLGSSVSGERAPYRTVPTSRRGERIETRDKMAISQN